jgi:hypothetical protein
MTHFFKQPGQYQRLHRALNQSLSNFVSYRMFVPMFLERSLGTLVCTMSDLELVPRIIWIPTFTQKHYNHSLKKQACDLSRPLPGPVIIF